MKFTLGLSLIILIILTSSEATNHQYKSVQFEEIKELHLVTFECNSCTKKNKFLITGPEEHTFKAVTFPIKIELESGEYEMTYWQNRIQQIHLPFDVSFDSENIIIVKD